MTRLSVWFDSTDLRNSVISHQSDSKAPVGMLNLNTAAKVKRALPTGRNPNFQPKQYALLSDIIDLYEKEVDAVKSLRIQFESAIRNRIVAVTDRGDRFILKSSIKHTQKYGTKLSGSRCQQKNTSRASGLNLFGFQNGDVLDVLNQFKTWSFISLINGQALLKLIRIVIENKIDVYLVDRLES